VLRAQPMSKPKPTSSELGKPNGATAPKATASGADHLGL
jgi:hypothetical protein